MESLQEKFDKDSSDCFTLSPDEYEGPLVITHPCTVDGNMSTIWCNQSPVISIQSAGVTIKNLRIELLGEHGRAAIALQTVTKDLKLYNVEVNRGVSGLPQETDTELPNSFLLGTFAAEEINVFTFSLTLSTAAEIIGNIQDIEIMPIYLTKGTNIVTIKTKRLRDNTIVYGSLFIKTTVLHRINLLGKASKEAAVHAETNYATPPKVKEETVPQPIPSPPPSEIPKTVVMRGQRLPIKGSVVDVSILLDNHEMTENLDCYVFSLLETGKVGVDEDVIFFGNQTSLCADVALKENSKGAIFDLSKTQQRISKFSVCFSFCGDDPKENFSRIIDPKILVVCGTEAYLFPMGNLMQEKTVVGVELYRYKNDWKINFVGAGFRYGAKELCEGYGVTVE